MSLDIYTKNNENCEKIEVMVIGELDINSSFKFQNELNQIVEQNDSDIYINLENLSYIDSTGLGILIGLMKKLKEKNCEIILLKPQDNMLKLLRITGLDKIFKIQ